VGRRLRRSAAERRAARDVRVGPARRAAEAGSAGATVLAAAAASAASGVGAAPDGFRRRRRRRLAGAVVSCPPSVGAGVAADADSATRSAPRVAASASAFGFDDRRRRERDRDEDDLGFGCAASAAGASLWGLAPSAEDSSFDVCSADVCSAGPVAFELLPRPRLRRRRRRVRGRAPADPSSGPWAWGSRASSVMPRSFPPRRSGASLRPRGAARVAPGDTGLRDHGRDVILPSDRRRPRGRERPSIVDRTGVRASRGRPDTRGSGSSVEGGGQGHRYQDSRGNRPSPGAHLNLRMWTFSSRPIDTQFVSMAVPP
jgi:hypothetical protein